MEEVDSLQSLYNTCINSSYETRDKIEAALEKANAYRNKVVDSMATLNKIEIQ